MKLRGLIVLVLLGLALLAAVFLDPHSRLLGAIARESFYQGRPTRSWQRSLRDPSQAVQKETEETLQKGGAAATPVLAELVRGGQGGDWDPQGVRARAAALL